MSSLGYGFDNQYLTRCSSLFQSTITHHRCYRVLAPNGYVEHPEFITLTWREPVTLHETTAIIAVPNDFTRTQLEGRLRTRLEDSLTAAFGTNIRIAVTVNPQLDHGIVVYDSANISLQNVLVVDRVLAGGEGRVDVVSHRDRGDLLPGESAHHFADLQVLLGEIQAVIHESGSFRF